MIPRYYKCGDTSGRCPRSLSKDIVSDKNWNCPCGNPRCDEFRQEVSWITLLLSNRKLWMILGAVAALGLIAVIANFGRTDKVTLELKRQSERLDALDQRFTELEGLPGTEAPDTKLLLDAKALNKQAQQVAQDARAAVAAENDKELEKLGRNAATVLTSIQRLKESIAKPASGAGGQAVEAKQLAGDYDGVESELESFREQSGREKPASAEEMESLITRAQVGAAKARQLGNRKHPTKNPSETTLAELDRSRGLVEETQAAVAAYKPKPRLTMPFAKEDATLKIATTRELAATLVLPLLAQWAEAKPVSGPDDRAFLVKPAKGDAKEQKILLQIVPSEDGFAGLAGAATDLLLIDRQPNPKEQELLGRKYGVDRSMAEVVAMDALTLLVHPNNPLDTWVGNKDKLRIVSGPQDSSAYQHAKRFGFQVDKEVAGPVAEAALGEQDILALGLYHQEGDNPIRAKRLEVKAQAKSIALKPSPFTIATEDYIYSFRIVAWNPPQHKTAAMDFVRFITTDAGQDIVGNAGYVDLRLRPVQGAVEPKIMATLGVALGVAKINAATRLSTNFRFAVGDANLDVKAQADIERLPRYLANAFSGHKVVILGFTDNTGTVEENIKLSKDRALACASQLDRFNIKTASGGLGMEFPVAANDTDENKARNRRAEVWVVKP